MSKDKKTKKESSRKTSSKKESSHKEYGKKSTGRQPPFGKRTGSKTAIKDMALKKAISEKMKIWKT